MKKSTNKSKLKLDRQALRDLRVISQETLGQVQGATNDDLCSFCGENSCRPH